MPIRNEKGLAALKALSTGGTPGLDSYRQAQASEAASRTTALQNALGSNDVAAAAQKAQAQYAPKVAGTPGIDNLNVAADSYLSNAANKLAAQQYEGQQNLALQAEALRRQQTEISDKEKQQMLLGAADAMAAQQRGDLQANLDLGTQATNLAQRKAAKRAELTAFDQNNQGLALAAAAGHPELLQQAQAQRQAILDEMGALDKQFAESTGQYTGYLGTDNKGLLEAYNAADRGDTSQVQGLVNWLNPRRETALQAGNNAIDMGEQGRLRELAPAFGINPLTAAGMFREGEGQELGRVKQREAEQGYVAGGLEDKAGEAAAIKEGAAATGLSESKYTGLRQATGLTDEEIVGAVQSADWGPISEIANKYVGKDRTKNTGVAGFRQDVEAKLKDLVDEQGKPVPDDVKKKMLELAVGYYSGQIAGSKSEAESK